MRFIDLSGKKFGKLTAISRTRGKDKRRVYWICKCECGKETIVQAADLKSGHTRSCGCLLDGSYNITHGMTHTRLYRIWFTMKQRCTDRKSSAYCKYGAKGITICSEWLTFEPFMKWSLENGYSDKLSIDRIDNNKGYYPDNCRYVTNLIQANNKTDNIYIEINGETHTLAEWCRIYDIKYYAVRNKMKRGKMSAEDALMFRIEEKKNKLKP